MRRGTRSSGGGSSGSWAPPRWPSGDSCSTSFGRAGLPPNPPRPPNPWTEPLTDPRGIVWHLHVQPVRYDAPSISPPHSLIARCSYPRQKPCTAEARPLGLLTLRFWETYACFGQLAALLLAMGSYPYFMLIKYVLLRIKKYENKI